MKKVTIIAMTILLCMGLLFGCEKDVSKLNEKDYPNSKIAVHTYNTFMEDYKSAVDGLTFNASSVLMDNGNQIFFIEVQDTKSNIVVTMEFDKDVLNKISLILNSDEKQDYIDGFKSLDMDAYFDENAYVLEETDHKLTYKTVSE